jgi:serine/threonine-protein kinase
MTGAGVLLGTAAYMSPEQARGKKADKRADIWAFGVVLWEMLTGLRLFEGETVSDTLAAVLRADPDWEALGPETPRPLHRLLRRCLERNPKERLHDIADARLEIGEAIDPAQAVAGLEAEQHEPGLEGRKKPWVGLTTGLVLGSILAGLGSMWLGGGTSETSSRTVRVASALPDEVVLQAIAYPVLAISPDGQRLVIAGQQGEADQLYQRVLSQFEWQPIAGTEGAYIPFFSPNGEWIAFFADGKLKKVSLAGGASQVLSDAPNPWGGTWGPDGTIVYFPSSPGEGLMQVSELGGAPELLTKIDTEATEAEHDWPQFLPDGKALVFTIWKGSVERSQIALLDLETGEKRVLIDGSYGRVVPTGHLLYALADSVYVVPFDLEKLEITGSPVPIPDPIYRFADYWLPYLAVATDGTMVYLPGRSDIRRQLVTVGLDGTEKPIAEKTEAYMYPRVSPDGSKLAVNLMEAHGASIWIIDLETGMQTRLSRESNELYPLWTPKGERIVFYSNRTGEDVIYWQPADGSGPAEELVAESPPVYVGFPSDISSDGRYLAFGRWEEHEDGTFKSSGIYVLSLEEQRELRPFLVTDSEDEGYFNATFSPDGRWIAYVSMDASQTAQVFVRSFPEGGASYQISGDDGLKVQWAPGGQEIYYRASDDRFMAVSVTTEPAFKAGIPRLLFEDKYSSGTYIPMPNYTVHPDGSRIIMVKPDEELGKASEIRIVFNWLDELEKLVPGGAR